MYFSNLKKRRELIITEEVGWCIVADFLGGYLGAFVYYEMFYRNADQTDSSKDFFSVKGKMAK